VAVIEGRLDGSVIALVIPLVSVGSVGANGPPLALDLARLMDGVGVGCESRATDIDVRPSALVFRLAGSCKFMTFELRFLNSEKACCGAGSGALAIMERWLGKHEMAFPSDTTSAPFGSHAICDVSLRMVVSINDSLLMEINPEVEFETNVGIHANDWSGFEEGLARSWKRNNSRFKLAGQGDHKTAKPKSNIVDILLRDFHRIGMPTSASSDSDSRTG